MKSMKLFLTVFAAILAAGAVILTGIYAKARLDDWEGSVFGKLVALRYAPESEGRESIYHCRCDCGTVITVLITNLLGGWVTACDECRSKT